MKDLRHTHTHTHSHLYTSIVLRTLYCLPFIFNSFIQPDPDIYSKPSHYMPNINPDLNSIHSLVVDLTVKQQWSTCRRVHQPGVIHHLPAPAVGPAGQSRPGLGHFWSQAGGQLVKLAQNKVWFSHSHVHWRDSKKWNRDQ